MKIISFNVNGIRAAISKNLSEWIKSANPDVVCFQELKANSEQFDSKIFQDLGYECFWFPAQKKGYSGVGIISKTVPKNITFGCGIEKYDSEGRILRLDFEDFSVMSVYVPSASNIERLDFKLEFCDYFLDYIKTLQTEIPNLVICGDFNICHEAIDIHDPVRLKNVSGFLPIEREWMTNFINNCELTDTFRYFNNEPNQYTWWSYRQNARAKNLGWRLDYHFVTKTLENRLKRSVILNEVYMSDHCPVLLEF
ncbi:MAG: exodeoxyribonuclease III [Flavobacteriaceae bacterium]|nr:exodeoxyribonuclease III [Flavobacteriaceae bacterium]